MPRLLLRAQTLIRRGVEGGQFGGGGLTLIMIGKKVRCTPCSTESPLIWLRSAMSARMSSSSHRWKWGMVPAAIMLFTIARLYPLRGTMVVPGCSASSSAACSAKNMMRQQEARKTAGCSSGYGRTHKLAGLAVLVVRSMYS